MSRSVILAAEVYDILRRQTENKCRDGQTPPKTLPPRLPLAWVSRPNHHGVYTVQGR